MQVQSFIFAGAEKAIADLRRRLRQTRWPDDFESYDWAYGSPKRFVQDLVQYWLDRFDWRDVERDLNLLPHFRAEINSQSIHFLHIRGVNANSNPLIINHGWPGSFVEMTKLIPLLTDPTRHGLAGYGSFDLVILWLPGFGFSSAPMRPGMNTKAIASLWHKLMQGLGYPRYFVQGGDIGAGVSCWMAGQHAEAVTAFHLNFIPGSYQPYVEEDARALSPAESDWQAARARWGQTEGGYSHIQGTRAQTLAYGLADSPAALAAWIVEKSCAWSDCEGDVLRRFSMDELLTNLSVYWFSGNVAATLRIYKENAASPLRFGRGERVLPPLSFALFPKGMHPPREWVERAFTVNRWTHMPRGGHFAAMEEPMLLARDTCESFAAFR